MNEPKVETKLPPAKDYLEINFIDDGLEEPPIAPSDKSVHESDNKETEEDFTPYDEQPETQRIS